MKRDTYNHPAAEPRQSVTLAACEPRTDYRVAALPPDEATRRRLHSLGLTEGRIVRKVSGQLFKGPVVIRVHGTELALGHAMAGHIRVEPIGGHGAEG